MRDDITRENDYHILAGIGYRHVARAEEIQNRVEKDQAYGSDDDADGDVQHHHISQNSVGHVVVFLAKQHRDKGGSSYADKGSEGCGKVHQGESDGQAGYGHRADSLSDEDAVDHVVQAGCCHSHDGRHGILLEQFADTLSSQLGRNHKALSEGSYFDLAVSAASAIEFSLVSMLSARLESTQGAAAPATIAACCTSFISCELLL